jgi:hypothetical protein
MNNKGEMSKLVSSMSLIGGVALFMSSYWVEDNKTAVNRRYAGLLFLGVGLYFVKTK